MNLAIIFTCFNRAEKTKKCLNSIKSQILDDDIKIRFYICDDASTDQTLLYIKEILPEATIINGEGGLYWSKGMYKAMNAAYQDNNDFYLMINDDVDFYKTSLQTMIDSYKLSNVFCGIVGTTVSQDESITTYGGGNFIRKLEIGRHNLLNPNGKLQSCQIANWNCFLLPKKVIDDIGLIDNYYEHGYGDYDYSLLMRRKGYPIYVATDYIGKCNRNTTKGTYNDKALSRYIRISKLFSIKALPIKSSIHFYWKNHSFLGIGYIFYVYIKEIYRILFEKNI